MRLSSIVPSVMALLIDLEITALHVPVVVTEPNATTSSEMKFSFFAIVWDSTLSWNILGSYCHDHSLVFCKRVVLPGTPVETVDRLMCTCQGGVGVLLQPWILL